MVVSRGQQQHRVGVRVGGWSKAAENEKCLSLRSVYSGLTISTLVEATSRALHLAFALSFGPFVLKSVVW